MAAISAGRPGKAADRHGRAERKSDQRGDRDGRQAHPQRQRDDLHEVVVERADQSEGLAEGAAEILHGVLPRSFPNGLSVDSGKHRVEE